MRFDSKIIAALVMVPIVVTQTPASALPCDNTRWCAEYSDGDSGLGGTNCGFFTLAQCRATVSGIGGFCVPNQFYNPCQASARRAHKKRRY
jgi:Protein of unknown function (DUF3551)